MRIELKEWMTPIIFEGVELSPISIVIDHLGMYDNLPDLSEETAKWLWQFTICRGAKKTDSAENIIKHINEALSLVDSGRDHLFKNVPKRFDGSFSDVHLNLWINDLTNILDACKDKSTCTWTAKE